MYEYYILKLWTYSDTINYKYYYTMTNTINNTNNELSSSCITSYVSNIIVVQTWNTWAQYGEFYKNYYQHCILLNKIRIQYSSEHVLFARFAHQIG